MVPQKGQVYFPPLPDTVRGAPQELHLCVMTFDISSLHLNAEYLLVFFGLQKVITALALRLMDEDEMIIQELKNWINH